MKKRQIIALVGATGTGKSDAGIFLANVLSGEIVNFDSRQVYKDVPIITAQPSTEEQSLCPHKLYGFLESDVVVRAGSFAERLEREIDEVLSRGSVPILVGGTGLYLKTLLCGLAPIPSVSEEIRAEVEKLFAACGGRKMHEWLQEFDSEYAAKIHPNDRQRICRAFEVFWATKIPFSEWHKRQMVNEKFAVLQLGLWQDLAELTPRLRLRIENMFALGAYEEMERAFAKCSNEKAPAFDGIGCSELLALILGRCDEKDCRELWLKNTRAYAKRQITWFKKDKTIVWNVPNAFEKMKDECLRFLGR